MYKTFQNLTLIYLHLFSRDLKPENILLDHEVSILVIQTALFKVCTLPITVIIPNVHQTPQQEKHKCHLSPLIIAPLMNINIISCPNWSERVI